jgi:hypothetical protein
MTDAAAEFHSSEALIPKPGAVVAITVKPISKTPIEHHRDEADERVARLLWKTTSTGSAAAAAAATATTTATTATTTSVETDNRRLSEKHGVNNGEMVMCWFQVTPMNYANVVDHYLLSAKRGDRTDKGITVEGYCDWRHLLELRMVKGVTGLTFEHPKKPNSRISLPR